MNLLRRIKRDESGAAVIEVAVALPVMVSLVYGVFQVAMLYQANAGMQHALGEGARQATLYDPSTANKVPSAASVKAKMQAKLFGKSDGTYTVLDPDVQTGHMNLTVRYTRKMQFLFINGPTITLTRSKKVYTVVA